MRFLSYLKNIIKFLLGLFFLYLFLVGIGLMETTIKGVGGGFIEQLLIITKNPIAGLFIGVLFASVMQSSSASISIILGLVAGGGLLVSSAIPMVMGASIGSSVVNIITSLGYLSRLEDFKRAFSASTVHGFFNLLAVIILFPLELIARPIEKSATWLAGTFYGNNSSGLVFGLKLMINPVISFLKSVILSEQLLLFLSLLLIFISLGGLVKLVRSSMAGRFEIAIDRYIFHRPSSSFIAGLLFTILTQSSSVTTSLVLPLAADGLLTAQKIFPYALGSSIGTTVIVILAALIVENKMAMIMALAYLLFHILGIIFILLFLRKLPARFANKTGEWAGSHHKFILLHIITVFYLLPILMVMLFNLF